jgi:hypothetical protein
MYRSGLLAAALFAFLSLGACKKEPEACKPIPAPPDSAGFVLDGGQVCMVSNGAFVAEFAKEKDAKALNERYRKHFTDKGWKLSEDTGEGFRVTGDGKSALILIPETSPAQPFPIASIVVSSAK